MSRAYQSGIRSLAQTPKTTPLPGQSRNEAGGNTWTTDPFEQLRRFLILGSEGGNYYVGEHEMTIMNMQVAIKALGLDPHRYIETIREISRFGRAPSNEPSIFAFAMTYIHGSPMAKREATDAILDICRTGTDILHFVKYVTGARGWGRALRSAVSAWFTGQNSTKLSYEVTKYASRDDWAMRDIIRLAHPRPTRPEQSEIFSYVLKGWDEIGPEQPVTPSLQLLWAIEKVKQAETADEVALYIMNFRMPREVIPTQWLKEKVVWEALLRDMPMHAMVRNLANLTRLGIIGGKSRSHKMVIETLTDETKITRSMMHPVDFLVASHTYDSGRSLKGTNTWKPNPEVMGALETALELSYRKIPATGKKLAVAIDVSNSMRTAMASGLEMLSAAEAASIMALGIVKADPHTDVFVFNTNAWAMPISTAWNWKFVAGMVKEKIGGGTDCSSPILNAMKNRMEYDGFVILTDNQDWYGGHHPSLAMEQYRGKMNTPDCKLAVVAMVSNGRTIASPDDRRSMNLVGFDNHVPQLVQEFLLGNL